MSIFKLPDLGEGLPDAVIREWYVSTGDIVTVDQPLVAMETAKALVDVPCPTAGVITTLHGEVGDTIDTGNPLVTFQSDAPASDSDKKADSGTVVGDIESSDRIIASEKDSMTTAVAQRTTQAQKATPQVRMLAQQLGVDLARITPAGDYITAQEIKEAAGIGSASRPAAKAKPEPTFTGKAIELNQVRRAMILSMEASLKEIVPVTLSDDAHIHHWEGKQDMTLRLLRAVACACQSEPNLNAFFSRSKQTIYQQEAVSIGLAVDTPEGLYVPVLKDIVNRSDAEIRSDINRFKEQASTRSFPAEDLKGATILLSNFGTFAGRYASPVLVPPLVAIVAVGKAREVIVSEFGEPVCGKALPLSVTADHRAVTGGELSRFLSHLIESLQKKA